mgnify:CR=1 FL=1
MSGYLQGKEMAGGQVAEPAKSTDIITELKDDKPAPKSEEKVVPSKSQIKPGDKPAIDNNNQDNC